MLATTQDLTINFNRDGYAKIDLSNWDFCVAHFIGTSGAISFLTSNDAGAITGVTDGNATSATNFVAVQGTNLSTGVAGTSAATSTLYRFNNIGRFLELSGAGVTVTKLILYLSKIS